MTYRRRTVNPIGLYPTLWFRSSLQWFLGTRTPSLLPCRDLLRHYIGNHTTFSPCRLRSKGYFLVWPLSLLSDWVVFIQSWCDIHPPVLHNDGFFHDHTFYCKWSLLQFHTRQCAIWFRTGLPEMVNVSIETLYIKPKCYSVLNV